MSLKNFPLNLENLRPWLTMLAVVWLLASLGLGWLVNSLLIIIGLLFLIPIIGFIGFQWWLQRNLIADQCPICGHEFTALNRSKLPCPNCGELLLVEDGHFRRFAPEGTIDVTAVEVSAKSIED